MIDVVGLSITRERRKLELTVLYREGGTWSWEEMDRFHGSLSCGQIHLHPQHPEYLILRGHHTKEETLEALRGGRAYVATQVTGIDSPELPFVP